jgi:ligand-binding SRPBCC domain-containing protein
MAILEIRTEIEAPVERCFLLSLSVDLHRKGAAATGEEIVGGIKNGLMKLNDTVTWRARHLGIKQDLTSRISAYSFPNYFISEQVKGAFKRIHHQHVFHPVENRTVMTDLFEFEAPFGVLGRWASRLFLERYMRKFLLIRNDTIKKTAESGDWKKYLEH